MDFVMEGGKLKAAMNTKASKDFHEQWVKMIRGSGPKNWSTYTWYQVGTDLGAGASGMIFDADILGYFMNGGENKEKGQLGYAPFAANPAAKSPTPNVWIWSLALSSFSKQKDAAWLFMQWAASTEHGLFGARKMDFVNPVRTSVWKDSQFRDRIAKSYPGYLEQFDVSSPGAKIYFTAQPLFFDLTTEWAASLQKMTASTVSSSKQALARPILVDLTSWCSIPPQHDNPPVRASFQSPGRRRCRRRLVSCHYGRCSTHPHKRNSASCRATARTDAALLVEPAGSARLRRHPCAIRDSGDLFAPTVPPEPALSARFHRRRQLHRVPIRSGVLEYVANFALVYCGHRGPRAAAWSRHRVAVAAANPFS
jgi:hypothetical protein